MKYIKYIAAALLLTAGLASCESGEGESNGTPGNTTVQFANAVVNDGFGAGYVYVPLTIESDTEEGMNSCAVQAKLKVVTTGEAFEGTPDLDGKSGGDYRVTSLDVNFPAYENYYNKKEPKKYYDEDRDKWVKQVQMEVKILNSEVDELRFSFEIESATTTIGEQKQCTVVLEKNARDRMCGNYTLTTSIGTYSDVNVSWSNDYTCFEIYPFADWAYTPLYTYYDEESESMYAYPAEPIMWYNPDANQLIYTAFYSTWGQEAKQLYNDYVMIDFDVVAGTLTFPADLIYLIAVYECDAALSPVTYLGRLSEAHTNMVLTKE